MGYIDKTIHRLTCECGVEESVTILETGSQYGSNWGKPKDFKNFTTIWGKPGFRGPEIISSECIKCKSTPKYEIF